MKRKVVVGLAIIALFLTVISSLPAQPPEPPIRVNWEKERKFQYERDWRFESASIIVTRDGQRYILSYKDDFHVSGKVLALAFFDDEQFMFSPVDIVVGWGDVILPENINNIEIVKDSRLFYWRNRSRLKDEYIASHLVNIHAIPSNVLIDKALRDIEIYSSVKISGQLIDIKSQSGKDVRTWESGSMMSGTAEGNSEMALVSMFSLDTKTYSGTSEVNSGKEIVVEEISNVQGLLMEVLSKYGIYFGALILVLLVLYLFNTLLLRGYSARKTDICILTTEGRERSFEYLRSFENFGDDILVILSHIRSKGPMERSALESKYGKKQVGYLIQKRYLELEKG